MKLARLENLLTVAGINLKKLLTRNELKLIIIMDSHPTYEELKLLIPSLFLGGLFHSHPTYEELKLVDIAYNFNSVPIHILPMRN